MKRILSPRPLYLREIVFIIIFVVIFLTTWGGLVQTYFQQDEWFGFSKALIARDNGLFSILKPTGFHFFPLTTAFFVFFFNIFGFHYSAYGIFSLLLHIMNACVVFVIVRKISGSLAGVLSFALFLLFYLSHQAFSWYAASLSILPGATFGLLSIYSFIIFISTQKRWYMFLSLFLWSISIGFKEDFFVFYFLYIFFIFIFPNTQKKYILLMLHFFLILTLGIRFVGIKSDTTGNEISINYDITYFLQNAFYRERTLFERLILPNSAFQYLQDKLVVVFGAFSKDKFVLMIIRAFLGVWIVSLVLKGINYLDVIRKKYLLVFFLSLCLSILPYLLLPQGLQQESRHFYLAVIFFSISLGIILSQCLKLGVFWKINGAVYFILFLYMNIYPVQYILAPTIDISERRVSFINQFLKTYNTIPKKVIFIHVGDVPPFQSGIGHVLMVLLTYYKRENYTDFFPYFLWNITANEYKEIDGRGFGYYYTVEQFKKDISLSGKSVEKIYIFEWDRETKTLTDRSADKTLLIE